MEARREIRFCAADWALDRRVVKKFNPRLKFALLVRVSVKAEMMLSVAI